MNRKPGVAATRFRNVVEQRLFLRRQATLDNLLQNRKLNLRNVITVKNFAWCLTWLICLQGAFFQSIGVVQSFLKSETTTSIEYVPTSDLPALTICFDKSDIINTDNETIRRSINKLDISQQLNFTYNYEQLFISCMVVTINDSVPCESLLTITPFVTYDYKCISLHEPKIDVYQSKIKSQLLLNHTNIYTLELNRSIVGKRFDLTVHNLTNPLQILDQNWVKLSPGKYSSAKISFKHIQMSLLPAPHDTNCSFYSGHKTKANCLNLCFIEEYYWKENYLWPPYVPGFNKKKKVLTNTVYFDTNSTNSEESEKRTKRQISNLNTLVNGNTSNMSTNSVFRLNIEPSTLSPTNNPKTIKPSGTASNQTSSATAKAKKKNKLLDRILGNLKKKNQATSFLTKTLFQDKIKLNFKKDEFELNTKKMSESLLSVKGIPDIRGYCDWRCDQGQECHEDIYKPVRETEIEAKNEEFDRPYVVEIQPSKYVFRCLTLEKYKRVHLACFLASTITLWFGGSIFFLVRHLIKGNLHTIRCLFCCNKKSHRN